MAGNTNFNPISLQAEPDFRTCGLVSAQETVFYYEYSIIAVLITIVGISLCNVGYYWSALDNGACSVGYEIRMPLMGGAKVRNAFNPGNYTEGL